MSSKPILFISPLPPPPGGIATWTQKIIDYGLPDGSNLSLVNTKIWGKRNIFDKSSFSLTEIIRTFYVFFSLLFQLIVNPPKVLHINSSLSAVGIMRDLLCAMAAKIFRIPIISHYHGNLPDFNPQKLYGFSGYCLRSLMQLSAVNIVENQMSLLRAKQIYSKAHANQILLLPNFIEDTIFKVTATKTPNTPLQVLFAGGITRAKGCLEILAVAKQLPHIEFHLVGKLHADISAQFECLPSNVFLHGVMSHADLLTKMQQSDLLLFPSHTEGFPLTVLEAMSLSLPIVATQVGAIPEMVDADLGGILVAPQDVQGLIHAITELSEKPEKRLAMGKYNREKSYANYRYSIVIKELTAIYARLSGALPCVE